jgi:hypothetical protein
MGKTWTMRKWMLRISIIRNGPGEALGMEFVFSEM